MQIPAAFTRVRQLCLAAVVLLFMTTFQAANAVALTFQFSVTNTIGTVPGTFTGEIFGLVDNATSSATSVLIETFPAGLNSLEAAPIDATLWDQQNQNGFTVVSGQITAGGFWAARTIGGYPSGYQLLLNGDGGPYNFLNLDGVDRLFVYGDNGFAAANFTRVNATAAPEPASLALAGLGAVALMAAAGRRRKS